MTAKQLVNEAERVSKAVKRAKTPKGTAREVYNLMRKIGNFRAATVVRYFNIYQNFLRANGLADDSDEIGMMDLLHFVEVEIDEPSGYDQA